MSKVEMWKQKQKKKDDKITKNSKKIKEIDVEILDKNYTFLR